MKKNLDRGCIIIALSLVVSFVPGYAEPDLSNHPLYTAYEFSKEKTIINIGAQPLLIPTNLISETMKRDIILKTAVAKLNMSIQFYGFLKGDDVNFFIKKGDIAAGIVGDMPAITAAATSNIVITNIVQYGFTSIVARKYMLIDNLRGKRIGYAFGSNAHYSLLRALSSGGLTENDVKLIPMDVDTMPEALHKGKIAAFSAWEPTPAITLSTYDNSVVIHRNLNSSYLYFTKTFADKHPEAMDQIAAAVIRAINWMQADSANLKQASSWSLQAAENLTGSNLDISVDKVIELAKKDIIGLKHVYRIAEKDIVKGSILHQEFELLKSLGKIPSSSDWDKISISFNIDIIDEIRSKPIFYKLDQYNYAMTEDTND